MISYAPDYRPEHVDPRYRLPNRRVDRDFYECPMCGGSKAPRWGPCAACRRETKEGPAGTSRRADPDGRNTT